MERNEIFTKSNKILMLGLIIITIIHILYAAFSQRALYLDGALQFLVILDGISQNKVTFFSDPTHHRYVINFITQLPVSIAYFLLFIKSKYVLGVIHSLFWFLMPVLGLIWSYKLSERTKRYGLFVLSAAFYSLIILLYQIFAIVEISTPIILFIILYNYISSDIDYTKQDILPISFLVLLLFGSYENVIFIGPILFIAALYFAYHTNNISNRKVKLGIGFASLIAGIYILFYMLFVVHSQSEGMRFFSEFTSIFFTYASTNFLLTLISLIIILIPRKNLFTKKNIIVISLLYVYILFSMFNNLDTFLAPVEEGHYRALAVFLFPIVLLILFIFDVLKINISKTFIINALSVILIAGISQTIWQINNTYWWNKNISYMQNELANNKSILYLPQEHEEISSFNNKDLRRYIWHFSLSATSLAFSKDYKIEKILSHYDTDYEEYNFNYRERLYATNNYFSIPTYEISIKNKFWDLSDVAKEIQIYNTKHKIKTN